MTSRENRLARRLGVFDLTCLGINGVIGSGVFTATGLIAADLGSAGPVAFLAGGALCFCVALCFAEMAGMHRRTGGAYLYATHAFGPFVGFLVGWMMWLAAVLGWATVAVALVDILEAQASEPWPTGLREAFLAGLVLGLAALNALGVRQGAWSSNLLAVAKLVPLALFAAWALPRVEAEALLPGFAGALDPVAGFLAVLYSFGGFEAVAIPAGEARNPQRSVPLALGLVLLLATGLYVLVQAVVVSLGLAGSPQAPVDAVRGHPWLAGLMAAGAVTAVAGVNAGIAFTGPRSLWALARDGRISPRLAELHPRFRTPLLCVAVTAGMTLLLALTGTFRQLLVASVLASLLQYLPTAAGVLVLRVRDPDRPRAFRIPGGAVIPALALGACLLLAGTTDPSVLVATAAALAVGALLYRFRPGGACEPRGVR